MIATAAASSQPAHIYDRGSLRKWKVTMRTSKTRARIFGSTVGKIVMAFVCASMIGGIFITPAFSEDHGRREGYQKQRRYKQSRRVYQPPRRYYYSEPIYAPPPVVYAPAPYQSPGITIVFPFN